MTSAEAFKLFQENVLPLIMRLLGAVAIWWIGRKLIATATSMIGKGLTHNKLDATLIRYATSILSGLMTVFLVLGIIEFLGIPTTSFAALAAGAGLAIGAAWSGMLANFAAGIFMIVMRPFKVGDEITGAGVNGFVKEIGLFTTTIDTADSIQTLVANSKLFGDNIQVHTAYVKRTCRVEFQLRSGTEFRQRMQRLEERIAAMPLVERTSARVEFEKFTTWGPLLSAQAECDHKNHFDVKADVAAAVQDVFGDLGFAQAPPLTPPAAQ